jgi:hypothetical protein
MNSSGGDGVDGVNGVDSVHDFFGEPVLNKLNPNEIFFF